MERRKPYASSGYGSYTPQQSYRSPTRSYSGMPGSNEMRGADIIAEYLVKENVPYILGYAGHGAIGLLDGIYKHTDKIRHSSRYLPCFSSQV
jgi:acetolactate synthase-1/2/3 large subunit